MSSSAVNAWVDTLETPLDNGETATVVAHFRETLETTEKADFAAVIEREVGYFQKHAHRMGYRDLSEKGYHIGSGVIESACPHVVAEWCPQARMRWSKTGIDVILFWRCFLKNGAWETYWAT